MNTSNLVPLLQNKMTILKNIRYQSMLFHINLQYTSHIHHLHVINHKEGRMKNGKFFRLDNNNPIVESNEVQYYLQESIIEYKKDNREDNIDYKMTWNNRSKLEGNNSKYNRQNNNKDKLHHNEYE